MLAGLKEFPLNLDLKGWFKKGLEPPVILKPKFVSCQTQLELLLLNYVSGSVSVVSWFFCFSAVHVILAFPSLVFSVMPLQATCDDKTSKLGQGVEGLDVQVPKGTFCL